MDLGLYKALAATLESIDKDGSVFCTCVTGESGPDCERWTEATIGRGDFFSAGADVKAVREVPGEGDSMKVRCPGFPTATTTALTGGTGDDDA